MTRVLIVDDENSVQKAFMADVEGAGERYTVVKAIKNAADAVLVCKLEKIDLVLMDLNTARNESGIEATRKIKAFSQDIKVVITTSYADIRARKEAREAGADSFWYKDFSPIDLIEVMDLTMAGENYWPEGLPSVEVGGVPLEDFTKRELETMYWLAKCLSIKKMAEKMNVEEATVKFHLRNLCRKVNCKNKTELLILIIQGKLVLPDNK